MQREKKLVLIRMAVDKIYIEEVLEKNNIRITLVFKGK
jgi:hypothetical protein